MYTTYEFLGKGFLEYTPITSKIGKNQPSERWLPNKDTVLLNFKVVVQSQNKKSSS